MKGRTCHYKLGVVLTFILLSDGKIIEDGSNNIILSFGNDRKSHYKYFLGVNYAAMWPVKSNFRLPVRRQLEVIGKLFSLLLETPGLQFTCRKILLENAKALGKVLVSHCKI